MVKKYSLAVVKEAVDIATGDDGLRSKEVVDLLEKEIVVDSEEVVVHDLKGDVLRLIDKVDELEQKIVNVDAKFDRKLDLMRKDIEGGKK